MPLTLVQRQTNQAGAGGVAVLSGTFSPAPTQNNLLICNAGSEHTLTMTSTGWTAATSSIQFSAQYQWYKIAGAGESATVTVTPSATGSVEIEISEWSGNVTVTPLDKTVSGGNAAGTTISSGTTAATTQADEQAVASFNWLGSTTANSYTNSFVEEAELAGLSSLSNTKMAVADKVLSATGAQSTVVTLSATTTDPNSGLVSTFKAAAATPVPTPSFQAVPFIPFTPAGP
jgi:hypothetical protein